MAYDSMDAVMEMTDLDQNEFAVLMSLAYHENPKTRKCNPSYETVAKYSRCSRATANRTLARLKEKGVISSKTVGNGSLTKHNSYILHLGSSCEPGPRLKVGSSSARSDKPLGSSPAQKKADHGSSFELGTGLEHVTGLNSQHATGRDLKPHSKVLSENQNQNLANVSKLIAYWNELSFVKQIYIPNPVWLEGGYPKSGWFANIVAFVSAPEWERRFDAVIMQYQDSELLQNGGKHAALNSLPWLFNNDSNIENVIAGKYRDRTITQREIDEDFKEFQKQQGSARV